MQMSLQRQHFLLSYSKTLSVGLAGIWTCDLPLNRLALSQLSLPGGDCFQGNIRIREYLTTMISLMRVTNHYFFMKDGRICTKQEWLIRLAQNNVGIFFLFADSHYLFPLLTHDWQVALTLTDDLLTRKTGRLLKNRNIKNTKIIKILNTGIR